MGEGPLGSSRRASVRYFSEALGKVPDKARVLMEARVAAEHAGKVRRVPSPRGGRFAYRLVTPDGREVDVHQASAETGVTEHAIAKRARESKGRLFEVRKRLPRNWKVETAKTYTWGRVTDTCRGWSRRRGVSVQAQWKAFKRWGEDDPRCYLVAVKVK